MVKGERKSRALVVALTQRRKLAAAFFALAGLAGAAFMLHKLGSVERREHPIVNSIEARQPSSIADDEPVIYSDESIEDLEREGRAADSRARLKQTSKERARVPFESVKGPSGDQAANALLKTGIQGRRAREVILNPEAFPTDSDGYAISLNLFTDFSPVAIMQRPSVYGVNQAFHVGQIQGDPSSQVQLMIAEGQMNGTIKTLRGTYRIVSLGARHHYVIEIDSKTSKR